jgi:putative chitinase
VIKITVNQLAQIAPRCPNKALVVDSLNKHCNAYGINSFNIFHEFIANVLHESAELTTLSESLNYSVQGLLRTFSRQRISAADAALYGRTPTRPANQRMIATRIYGGIWGRQNLGNNLETDGWELRGSGAMQLTGRHNIQSFSNYIKYTKTLYELANELRTNVDMSIQAACWVFAIKMKLIDEAEADLMTTIVVRINGGKNGMEHRLQLLDKAKKIFK